MLKRKAVVYIGLSIFLMSFSFVSIKYSTLASESKAFAFLGLAFLFILARAYTWQQVLKEADLSVAHPFMSLVQVLILIYSVVLFGEKVALHQVVGVVIMLFGLFMIAKSND